MDYKDCLWLYKQLNFKDLARFARFVRVDKEKPLILMCRAQQKISICWKNYKLSSDYNHIYENDAFILILSAKFLCNI